MSASGFRLAALAEATLGIETWPPALYKAVETALNSRRVGDAACNRKKALPIYRKLIILLDAVRWEGYSRRVDYD